MTAALWPNDVWPDDPAGHDANGSRKATSARSKLAANIPIAGAGCQRLKSTNQFLDRRHPDRDGPVRGPAIAPRALTLIRGDQPNSSMLTTDKCLSTREAGGRCSATCTSLDVVIGQNSPAHRAWLQVARASAALRASETEGMSSASCRPGRLCVGIENVSQSGVQLTCHALRTVAVSIGIGHGRAVSQNGIPGGTGCRVLRNLKGPIGIIQLVGNAGN